MGKREIKGSVDGTTSEGDNGAVNTASTTIDLREGREVRARLAGRPRVLCVAPAWNEGERIARVVKAVPGDWVETTVVVDDGSSDDTAGYAVAAGATVIRSRANRGV